jgi:signal transduction histidine kinase
MKSTHDVLSGPPARRSPLVVPAAPAQARSVGDRLAPLLQVSRLDELTTLTVRAAEDLASSQHGFMVLADPVTATLDLATARAGRASAPRMAIVRQIVGETSVAVRLGQGLHVRRATADDESWIVLPLVADSHLQGALALSLTTGMGLSARTLEMLRDFCRHAAPLLARVRELEELRQLVFGLTQLVHEGALYEARLGEALEDVHGLRTAEAMRGELLASVNHALRTPLVAIRGYARLLQQTLDGNVGPLPRQHLDVIARNAERMVDATRNLWAPPRVALRLAPVDLRRLWPQAVSAVRERANEKKLSLVQRLPSEPVRLLADSGRLQQMLCDLLTTAIALAAPGQVVRAEIRDEPARVTVSVDSKPTDGSPRGGVRPEDSVGGAGMWLDAVRESANLHGGCVAALVEADGELKLTVVLPRVSVEA